VAVERIQRAQNWVERTPWFHEIVTFLYRPNDCDERLDRALLGYDAVSISVSEEAVIFSHVVTKVPEECAASILYRARIFFENLVLITTREYTVP
jgi:hypothetical protein